MGRIKPLLSFYGDDFSGTTATAEALTVSGVPTVVFSSPPSIHFLRDHFPGVRAVGVAGTARNLTVDELESVLPPIFECMKSYQSSVFLYKVCSTFDSSKKIGSIGKAIEIGCGIFSPNFVPVLPAAPRVGRYTVFGNHFAALGQSGVYRLDRHPSMAHHPITPMKEADLRVHLSEQTYLKTGLINILDLQKGAPEIQVLIDDFVSKHIPIVFFDGISQEDLSTAVKVIWSRATTDNPVFMVGSQDVCYEFGEIWKKDGYLSTPLNHKNKQRSSNKEPLFVMSASCATVTGDQIHTAVESGFVEIAIQPHLLIDTANHQQEKLRIIKESIGALSLRKSVIAHTAIGPEDPRIEFMRHKAEGLGIDFKVANEILRDTLGEITINVLKQTKQKRIVVAGGDTAGAIQKHIGLIALQVSQPVGVAAPLCYVYSEIPGISGMEVAFKGGQIGTKDYFIKVQRTWSPDFDSIALGKLG